MKAFNAYINATLRKDEARELARRLATYEARITCPELPESCTDGVLEPFSLACWYSDWAKAMGCEGATLRALIEYSGDLLSPLLDGLPDPGEDWYERGRAEMARLDKVFGIRIYTIAETRERRADVKWRLHLVKRRLWVAQQRVDPDTSYGGE